LAFFYLSHALIIANARVNVDLKYKSYRDGHGLKQPVKDVLNASDIQLNNGTGFKELERFQYYIWTTKLLCMMV